LPLPIKATTAVAVTVTLQYRENLFVSLVRNWTRWCQHGFEDFRKKMPKRTWLCVGISPVWYAQQPGKSQKTREVF